MDETVKQLYMLILSDGVTLRQAKGSKMIKISWHTKRKDGSSRYRWTVFHIDSKRGRLWKGKTR